MALLTLTELHTLRGFMEPAELWDVCRDAAADAIRAPYGPSDRDDCAADLYGDIVARIAAETEPRRHGRPADVLAYIARVAAAPEVRQSAAMPKRDDNRVTFTALRNRAHDWRRKLETAREYEALMTGADRAPEDADAVPAEYIAAGARQDQNRARGAATEACRLLGLAPGSDEAPSPVWSVFYVWARETEAADCAAELSMSPDALHQRVSRARKVIRERLTAAELIARLTDGAPVIAADGTLTYALRDESRDARNRTRMLASEPRTAPEKASEVHTSKTAPDPEATARRIARKSAREDAKARRRLGRALARQTGRPSKSAVGRTSGKAAEVWAPREVRLGATA